MNKQIKVAFSIVILGRFLQLFVDYNYDWPDENWQGPEIAYKLANGYGFQTWQWTMQHPLRSIIYQAYLSIGYYVAIFFNFDETIKEKMAKLMQILIAILCDWFLLKIALVYTNKLKLITSLLILTNWFYFSMMNRTYINSIETSLTVVAYYYWLIRSKANKYDLISRIIVGICFIVRTTSIIIWAVIWPFQLATMRANRIKFIFKNIIQIFFMIIASIAFNSFWYQKFTFIEYNFFKYNILQKWSELYGVQPYFYYLYFAIPFILGGYLIPLVISLFSFLKARRNEFLKEKKNDDNQNNTKQVEQQRENKNYRDLFIIVSIALLLLSVTAHKQSRFLLVLTPFLLILSIKGIQKLEKNTLLLSVVIIINILFLLIFGLYGKSGGANILRQLRKDINLHHSNSLDDIAVIYLCEPHSLPAYSIIQKNITLRLLDTSPHRKLEHFNQQIELKNNPQTLYQNLSEGLKQSHIYLIIQEKYSIFNGYLREQYQFLLKNNFNMLKSERNVNLWQEYLKGYDGFVLLKKS